MTLKQITARQGGRREGISVIIPALNESATISSVVTLAMQSPIVTEVIVVDDGSIDDTVLLAEASGAKVITSTLLGKGASMEDGLRESACDIVLYLDGDLLGLGSDVIEQIAWPILRDEADFVKAKFARKAGRVTMLTAKPLLRTYFPELSQFSQPLSGIMAARKSLLETLRFENDYGVDVGLLVDAFLEKARIAEVDIGELDHRNHSLDSLGEMATQVARALMERAGRAGRLRLSFIHESKELERASRMTLTGFLNRVPQTEKLALFDMDGVILNGRFIVSLAEATHRESDLAALLDNYTIPPAERMRQIAAVFKGVKKETFESVAREIPLMPGVVDTIVGMRKAGYRVGIVTDSYIIAAETVRRRVFADFCFAHYMRFKNEHASGKVSLCPPMIHANGCCEHDHCKMNVLLHLSERLELSPSRIMAVGDGMNDVCMLRHAGVSVAFQPKNHRVRKAAQHTATRMGEVLRIATAQLDPVREPGGMSEFNDPVVSN